MSERVLLEAHAHTKEVSRCGWLFANEVVAALAKRKYGAVVITDHYLPKERERREDREAFLSGFRLAKQAGEALQMIVLPGIEIRFRDKMEDFLVYGMDEDDILDLPDDVCSWNIRMFHDLAKTKGWLVYQAHPFRPKLLPANPTDIDGMETFNGNPRHNSQNRLAAGFATRHTLRSIAGSDIHREGDAGIAGLLVPKAALTPKKFSEWLGATPHPRVQYQESPIDGIRYVTGAIPGPAMLEALYHDGGLTHYLQNMNAAMRGLEHSHRIVTAWDDTTLIGMARAIGDQHTVVFVKDAIVLGTFRRRGIGRGLLRRVLAPYANVRQTILIANDAVETRMFCQACGFRMTHDFGCASYMRINSD